jgi:hypothetical protein
MTITEKLDPEFKAKWIAALRSGEYKQGEMSLCRETPEGKEYCCLGVGYRVAKGFDPPDTNTGYISGNHIDIEGVPELLVGSGGTRLNEPTFLGNSVRFHLANKLNDKGVPFSEIADWIEVNL